MKWTGSEAPTGEEREPLLIILGSSMLIVFSIAIYTMYFLRMIPRTTSDVSTSAGYLGTISFYIALLLLVIKGFIKREIVNKVLELLSIIMLAICVFLGSIFELSKLINVNYIVMPPLFILESCVNTSQCGGFSILAISIPLAINFALLVYGIIKLLKACSARLAKDRSNIEFRPYTQTVNNEVSK